MNAQPLRTRRDYGAEEDEKIASALVELAKVLTGSVEVPVFNNHDQNMKWNRMKATIEKNNWEPDKVLHALEHDEKLIKAKIKKREETGYEGRGDDYRALDVIEKAKKYYTALKHEKTASVVVADEVQENSGSYKVDLNEVKKHDSSPQYLKLVRNEIKSGEGTVDVKEIENGMASIYGTGTHTYFLGCPQIPVKALKKI